MRLSAIEDGKRRFKHRLMFKLMPLITGSDVPDVMKLLTFRPDYFGQRFSELVHASLRGESEWSPAQRELFAAFTARVHECRF